MTRPDIEPVYVAQTFEPEHLKGRHARREWFQAMLLEAKKDGATVARMTISKDGDGLLFEAWTEWPLEQGEFRWSYGLEKSC